MFSAALQIGHESFGSRKGLARFLDWRLLFCGSIIGVAALPTLWLLFSTVDIGSLLASLHGSSIGVLKRTFLLFGTVIAGALAFGWPLGTLIGLVRFPGQRVLFAALAVPMFTPASLWAIGMSCVRPLVAYRHQLWFDGFYGALFTGLVQVLPLVVFASYFLSKTIPGSQLDAALLAAGWPGLLRVATRFSFPGALAAGVLGGLVAISDPGPAQIMGYHGMASEIFISFSARYNAALAAQKALLLCLLLLPLLLPLSWMTATWSENHLLGRDIRRVCPGLSGIIPWLILLLCGTVLIALLSVPIVGFIRPLHSTQTLQSFKFAWSVLKQSAPTTIRYCFTAAVLSSLLGFFLTLVAGRKHQGRFLLLLFSFVFLSMPASLHALGFAGIASQLPDSFDWLTRGGNAPGLAFAFRWLPIPTLFCLRAWSLVPETCHECAALHGIPAIQYHWRTTVPQLFPVLICSFVLVALASAADVSSTLILIPPGAATFTTRIFGVIDSTTERTLSVLCLLYIASGFVLLTILSFLSGSQRRT